ncbi:hypothetical protein HMPREF0724_13703 [Prescottella equi ATCC 33707]|uniref:Uncharacterized protein n=1 Tax=Prescottella equi ATCC 33707 TaxID=525370 RepID=E9T575_RHOHA|nr:hypothetical protein HMPREF0724_13703 [Prescottella equi ATCC 33707]
MICGNRSDRCGLGHKVVLSQAQNKDVTQIIYTRQNCCVTQFPPSGNELRGL